MKKIIKYPIIKDGMDYTITIKSDPYDERHVYFKAYEGKRTIFKLPFINTYVDTQNFNYSYIEISKQIFDNYANDIWNRYDKNLNEFIEWDGNMDI